MTQLPSGRALRAKENLYALLEVDVSYDGWASETADKKAFYVRGFTWFRDQLIKNRLHVADCSHFVSGMKEIIASRPAWLAQPFRWDEPFGFRQFVDAASPKKNLKPKFQKAVEIIVLCEAIAAYLHKKDSASPPPEMVYEYMRVEPAVSFIHGFDGEVLKRLSQEEHAKLRKWTGQRSPLVFADMAANRTSTHKLARWTLNFLTIHGHATGLGEVDDWFNPRKKYEPARDENVHVKEKRDLPDDAHIGIPSFRNG